MINDAFFGGQDARTAGPSPISGSFKVETLPTICLLPSAFSRGRFIVCSAVVVCLTMKLTSH